MCQLGGNGRVCNSLAHKAMSSSPLFRLEAIEHTKYKTYGSVSINVPVPLKIASLICGLFAISIGFFLLFAEFSDHCLVRGFLNSVPPVVRVYAMQPGVLDECFVAEGDLVQRGERLCQLNRGWSDARLLKKSREWQLLQRRQQALQAAITAKKQDLVRLERLFKQHYITLREVQAKQNELAGLDNQLSQWQIELIRLQQVHTEVIRAPIAGIVTNRLVEVGQRVQSRTTLLSIVPKRFEQVAELFVPASLMRFVACGKKIALRYDAYPYQHYGTVNAVIERVSPAILMAAEEEKPIRLNEPYYKVLAKLMPEHEPMHTYLRGLPQGMTLQAVIPGVRKKLWRWVLERG